MLTKDQLKANIEAMEKQGASQTEVQEYLNVLKPKTAQNTTKAQKEIEAGKKADEFLKKPWYKQLFSGRVAKELPSATAQTVIGTPAKFIASTAEIPETIIKGKATQRTYDLPGLQPFQSFQSEAQQRVEKTGKAMSGIGRALWEVPLAGIETYIIGKYAIKVGKAGINALKARNIKKSLENSLEVIKPVLTKAERQQAIMKAGKEGGAIQRGPFKKFDIAATQKDYEIADAVRGVVSKNNTPVKNATKINKAIEDIAQNQISPVLKSNPIKMNYVKVEKALSNIEKPISIKSDASLNKAFDLMKETAVKVIKQKNPKTTLDLWEARKAVDAVVKRELGNVAFNPEKANAINKAWMEMRKVINGQIAESLPNAGKVFTEGMSKMSNMYSALERIGENAQKLMGTNIWTRIWKGHPFIRKVIKYGVPTSGGIYGLHKLTGD